MNDRSKPLPRAHTIKEKKADAPSERGLRKKKPEPDTIVDGYKFPKDWRNRREELLRWTP